MDMKPKVYILVDNKHQPFNFLKAAKYGELITIFDHVITPTFMQGKAGDELYEKLCEINPDDYLIPVGPPALIALAGHIWLTYVDYLKILTWDKQINDYYVVEGRAYD